MTQLCTYCHQETSSRLEYRLILKNGMNEVTCCAHCGLLRHRQLGDQVEQAICHDFLRHTTISARLAWYVFDTSLEIGCRSEEHTSELQSRGHLVCRLLLEKKKQNSIVT